ncbi:2144_t:CDS:2, partial [Racocetra persica]
TPSPIRSIQLTSPARPSTPILPTFFTRPLTSIQPTSPTTPSTPTSPIIPSTPIHLTSSTISPVVIISPSAISTLRQQYSTLRLPGSTKNNTLHEEIAQLRCQISDLEATNRDIKKEIETLVMINDKLDKESDIQLDSDIFKSDEKSEGKGEVEKKSFDHKPLPPETRSFDLKAAR